MIARARRRVGVLVAAAAAAMLVAPTAFAEDLPASLSDLRVTDEAVSATLLVRGDTALEIDAATVEVTLGGASATVAAKPAEQEPRSTMLVIDTSGSMGASGMATVRSATKEFLDVVPQDVKVGVVSFASTSGVDVAPTTDHAKVSRAVASLVSKGETALYAGIQDAVGALGTEGERSIVLLSDGGDTVSAIEGGKAREASQRKAAAEALTKAKVRAEVVAFNTKESNSEALQQFVTAGGGSLANAADRDAVAKAFGDAARALESQVLLDIDRPSGVSGEQELVVTGTANGQPFEARSTLDLGDTAPVVVTSAPVTAGPSDGAAALPATALTAIDPTFLGASVLLLTVGMFLLVLALAGPVFRSRRAERVSSIELYGFGTSSRQRQAPTTSALSEQLIHAGDRVMEGRKSTTRTMALMDRADLPWRAGEWFVIRLLSVVIGGLLGYILLLGRAPLVGAALGLVLGVIVPSVMLRFLARRRAKRFEAALPDVLMLVATSLSSGFSLLQALDAVAKDAAEPCAKEFSRALAETRIGADVSDALEHLADRMDSENMRWATMAIRIQREVGGNLAETLRTTAATLREREMLKRQVRALSAEGRLSAYILIALPILLFIYMLGVNREYISLLWTNLIGLLMLASSVLALVVGVFWMRKVVEIEV